MKKGKVLLLILIIALFAGACKSRKKTNASGEKKEALSQVDSVFTAMKAAEYKFEWLKGKFSGLYTVGTKKQNFSGQFRIRRDSLIWCSITVMNIEVARVMVTPDSVKLLNRLNKKCFISTIDYLNSRLNTDVDFDMLQALLLGNDIPYYETDKFELVVKPDVYCLNTVGRGKLKEYVRNDDDLSKVLIQKIRIDRTNNRIIRQNIRQLRNPNKKLVAKYSAFEDFGGLFPTKVEFQMIGVKIIKVDFEFQKIEKDIPQKFPFKIPRKYKIEYK